jgi:hypothetical protein
MTATDVHSMPLDDAPATAAAPTGHDDTEPTTRDALILAGFGALLVLAWVASGLLFGLPGIYVPAVILTPIMMVTLTWVARG